MTDEEVLQGNVAAIALGLGRRAKNSRVIFATSTDGRPRGVLLAISAAEHFADAHRNRTFPYDRSFAISKFVGRLIGLSKAGILSPSIIYFNACECISAAEYDRSDPKSTKLEIYSRYGSGGKRGRAQNG